MNLLEDTPASVRDTFSPSHPLAMLNADVREACGHLPRDFFSLILTSPPYNIGKQIALQNGTLRVRPPGKPVHTPSGREKVAQIPMQWLEAEDAATDTFIT